MPKFYLTQKAVKDLNEIWEYTFDNWSEEQADRYYDMLLRNCQEIANNPDLGKKYDSIYPGLLGFKTNRHIIFYRQQENTPLEIIRILHGRMDLENRIKE